MSSEEYAALSQIENSGILRGNMQKLRRIFENGFLQESAVKDIKHPLTDDIEYYSMYKVEQLILQITQQCNLRCSYCTYSGNYYNRGHSDKKMTFEVARKAIDFYFEHSREKDVRTIAFYGGEPLFEFSLLKKCVEYAESKTKDKELFFYLTTNGTLLTEQIISYLREHRVNVTVSLDGYKEAHDSNRKEKNGEGSFDLIMDNLRKMREYDEDFFATVRFNTVVSPKANWSRVFDFFSESKLINPYHVKLTPVADEGLIDKTIVETDESFWVPYRFEYMKVLFYMVNKMKFADIHPSYEKGMYDIKRLYNTLQHHYYEQSKEHHGGPCIPGVQRLFVTTVGEFYPCERVSETMPEMNIGSLDTGYNIGKMRTLLNIGDLSREHCLDCWNLRLCKICPGQIEPVDNEMTYEGKLARCMISKNDVLESMRELCVLNENGLAFLEEGEYEA